MSLVDESQKPDIYPLLLPQLKYQKPRKFDFRPILPSSKKKNKKQFFNFFKILFFFLAESKITFLVSQIQRYRDEL